MKVEYRVSQKFLLTVSTSAKMRMNKIIIRNLKHFTQSRGYYLFLANLKFSRKLKSQSFLLTVCTSGNMEMNKVKRRNLESLT